MIPRGLWSAYCDGSGTYHGDSPACVGVVLADPDGEIVAESSAFICLGSNNVAELWAIRRALYLIRHAGGAGRCTPTVIYSDSEYAIGSATSSYAPKKNVELVYDLQTQVDKHAGFIRFEHVPGHSGVPGNELADWLAGRARYAYMRAKERAELDEFVAKNCAGHVVHACSRVKPYRARPVGTNIGQVIAGRGKARGYGG